MKYALSIIENIYREQPELKQILLRHSEMVCRKALEIGKNSALDLDWELVERGAMLHDIGIIRCHAPGILCRGELPYICHGVQGAEMLREISAELEPFARICERHTGSGLTAEEIIRQALPLPRRDLLPESPEEKLICLADKFFSKSGTQREKTLASIRSSMADFGEESLERFDGLCRIFDLEE